MIDLRYVKKLVEMLDESTVDSIEISTEKGMKIRISKTPQQRGGVSVAAPMPIQLPAAAPMLQAAPSAQGAESAAAARADEARANYLEVKSPMVGTYYRSPAPEAPPYIEVGGHVARGQTLCILEAMKLMNEMESEVSGVVREICVENAEPVEYGQVLFRIEPDA